MPIVSKTELSDLHFSIFKFTNSHILSTRHQNLPIMLQVNLFLPVRDVLC